MAYQTRADVEAVYGVDNVAKWADLNGNKVDSEITSRISSAIADADAMIDDKLRGGPYKTLPFSPVPLIIKRAAALLAGVILYESRGVTEFNVETNEPQHRLLWSVREVDRIIKGVRSGLIRLDDPTNERTSVPQAVKETT